MSRGVSRRGEGVGASEALCVGTRIFLLVFLLRVVGLVRRVVVIADICLCSRSSIEVLRRGRAASDVGDRRGRNEVGGDAWVGKRDCGGREEGGLVEGERRQATGEVVLRSSGSGGDELSGVELCEGYLIERGLLHLVDGRHLLHHAAGGVVGTIGSERSSSIRVVDDVLILVLVERVEPERRRHGRWGLGAARGRRGRCRVEAQELRQALGAGREDGAVG